MRIVSGKWRGRRLVSFNSKAIRPTTDRVKETIFNMIGPDIVDAHVLDLFSGTGSLSFEALSRGASKVVSVDKGSDSKKIFDKNLKLLGGSSQVTYLSQDVFHFLKKNVEQFDFILIDPPFTQQIGADCIRALADASALHENTRVFIECVKGEEAVDACGALIVDKVKNYGDKSLRVYSVKTKEDAP